GEVRPLQRLSDVADDSLGDLRDLLYRGVHRGHPCLKATMLLGNHDTHDSTPLPEIPFQLKAFNRSPNNRPFLFMTHGDCFDLLELMVPEPIKAFFVHFIGRLTPSNTYSIGDFAKPAPRINKPIASLENGITQAEQDLAIVGALKVEPETALPEQQVRLVEATESSHRFADYYRALSLPEAAASDAVDIRVIAAGHTHHAAMLLCNP